MPKRPFVYAALLIGAVIGLVLLAQPHKPKKKRGSRPSARSVQPRVPKRPKQALRGTVRQKADGSAIAGATVFVLPKKKQGGERDKLPHEVTDAQGRWTLRARAIDESWIGVIAKGYRHAWLDGSSVDLTEPLVHEMQRAQPLVVRVVDEETGAPIGKKGVQLQPWPPRTTYFLPGPRARQGEQWKVTDEETGGAVFRVGDNGPVTLTAHVEGCHCVSGVTWVGEPIGTVTLRMRTSRSLHLKLTRAEDGAPLRSLVSVDLHRPSGGLALSYTDTPDADGVVRIERGIRPATYNVHVYGEGRASVVLPALALDGAAEPALASARLAPAPAPATLRLAMGKTVATRGPGGRRRRAPLVFLFRPAEIWRSHGWEPGAPESWDAARGRLELILPPDRYHVLIADVLSRRATLLRNVELPAGKTLDVDAPLRLGLHTSVNPLIAANGKTREVGVAGVGVGRLPVYGITSDGRIRVSSSEEVLGRVDEGLGVYVGPYPFELITLRVTGWDGKSVTHDVER